MASTKKASQPVGSDALIQLGLELLAVSLFTLIAGASNEVGTLVVLFMGGMWMIYLIENSKVIAGLEKAMEAAAS
jgi:hypothetical protein